MWSYERLMSANKGLRTPYKYDDRWKDSSSSNAERKALEHVVFVAQIHTLIRGYYTRYIQLFQTFRVNYHLQVTVVHKSRPKILVGHGDRAATTIKMHIGIRNDVQHRAVSGAFLPVVAT